MKAPVIADPLRAPLCGMWRRAGRFACLLFACAAACDAKGPGQVMCSDRTEPLSGSARCDGKIDCRGGEDERACPDQLLCGEPNHYYIVDAERFCDGVIDCRDSARHDEHDCPDTFLCIVPQIDGPNTSKALPQSKVCDGTWDCASDELDCPGEDRFACADGTTIDPRYLCDHRYHCLDGSDEKPAACPAQFECTEAAWRQRAYPPGSVDPTVCLGNCDPLFVQIEKLCDGKSDCRKAEDESETNCPR